jgi:cytochrome c-type biogenesis protein CcmF
VVLVAARIDRIAPASDRTAAPVSRDTSFLLNNLVLGVFAFSVLVGTVYPLLNQALTGDQVSVGEPWFERVARPIGVALLFLMGVGPALPWGAVPIGTAARRLALPTGIGAAAAVAGALLGLGAWGVAAAGLAGFATVASLREIGDIPWLRGEGPAWRRPLDALLQSRRRVGAHLAHLGVAAVAVVLAASGSHRVEGEVRLVRGQETEWQGYRFRLVEADAARFPHRTSERAHVRVARGSRDLGVLVPTLDHYPRMSQPLTSPAVHTGWTEDLYLSILRFDDDGGGVSLHAFREPLVGWLWAAGLIMVAGGLVAALPRRPRRTT